MPKRAGRIWTSRGRRKEQDDTGLVLETLTTSPGASLPPEVEGSPAPTPEALPKTSASVQVSVPRAASVPTYQFLSVPSLFLTQIKI